MTLRLLEMYLECSQQASAVFMELRGVSKLLDSMSAAVDTGAACQPKIIGVEPVVFPPVDTLAVPYVIRNTLQVRNSFTECVCH